MTYHNRAPSLLSGDDDDNAEFGNNPSGRKKLIAQDVVSNRLVASFITPEVPIPKVASGVHSATFDSLKGLWASAQDRRSRFVGCLAWRVLLFGQTPTPQPLYHVFFGHHFVLIDHLSRRWPDENWALCGIGYRFYSARWRISIE